MSKTEIMDVTKVCRNFPENPSKEIKREHFLNTIDKIFEDNHVIVVEGLEGIGKTTLLAQFANRHPNNSISLFIVPTCRLAYSPEYLGLILAEQIYWLIHNQPMKSDLLDESFLRIQIPALQKRAQKNREIYYFILDGLEDIPTEGNRIQEYLLKDLLPLGLSNFRFLLSGDLKQYFNSINHRLVRSKSFPLSPFGLSETEIYLSDLKLERKEREDVHQMCGGIPGHLTIVKRMIESGNSVRQILDEYPDSLNDFLRIEWKNIVEFDELKKKILAIAAQGRKTFTLSDLGQILSEDSKVILEKVKSLSFLKIDANKNEVNFVSEAHRKFADNQLKDLREEINSLLINDLLKDINSVAALSYLPSYYEQANRLDELVDCLTPNHFTQVLELNQSLQSVLQRAELGLMAARKKNRNEALLRFSLQKSVISELTGAEIWRSEIEARMALNDYESALALTQSVAAKEDRFHMLVSIAKILKKKGAVPDEINEQINLLYEQIDFKNLGQSTIDIAEDLICVNPDLAIKLVEVASSNQDKETADWAYASLSFAALKASKDSTSYSDAIRKARSKISDPKLHDFSTAASILFREYTAEVVIMHVNKLEVNNRLYFLKNWLMINQNREDAAVVIDSSLDLLIKNTSYTPRTKDLRELASPLPYLKDFRITQTLVGRFDSQKASIEKLGTSVDYVRLQILLALAESKYDLAAAKNRALEIYWYISVIEDLTIKSESFAWFAASFQEIDKDGMLEKKEGLQTIVDSELASTTVQLLLTTADHIYATNGILKALSKNKQELAFDIITRINTEDRRDLSLLDLIKALTDSTFSQSNITIMDKCINHIIDPFIRDEALTLSLRALSRNKEDLDESDIKNILPLINSIQIIKDTQGRAQACCFAYILLKEHNGKYVSLSSSLLEQLESAWSAIDITWLKVDEAFKITRRLAKSAKEVAITYLEKAERLKDEIVIDSDTPARVYLACVRLAIRAFTGLLPRKIYTKQDVDQLALLIDRIPSNGERAILWSELATRCHLNSEPDLCKSIITEHVKPLISYISDEGYKYHVLREVAPALYCAHSKTAFEIISTIPQPLRDKAYDNICNVIFRKQTHFEPHNPGIGDGFLITYEDVVDICEILKLISTDNIISKNIAFIADSLIVKRTRHSLTREQLADIVVRLRDIISKKLPDGKNIKHDGYKIVSEARVLQIEHSNHQDWQKIIDAARKIPNVADKALVLYVIAGSISAKNATERRKVIEESLALIETMPSLLDRIERYHGLAEESARIEPLISKKCLKLAMEISVAVNRPGVVYASQKRIIDLAYRLDPNFASSLADLVDDDPARLETKTDIKNTLKLLDTKKKMTEEQVNLDKADMRSDYPNAAWMNLGGLNAGRVEPVHFDIVRDYIQIAAKYPVKQAYPIVAWCIENVIKRSAKTEQARIYIVPMFEATLLAAELAGRIAKHSINYLKQVKTQLIRTPDTTEGIIVKPGEREHAIQFLISWLEKDVKQYLKICDPYFGPADLEVLKIINSIVPSCKVSILTSKFHQNKYPQPWEETFRSYWRINISDQTPPMTEIVITGTESTGELPIHDRWWISENSGLRIGTSFNSLGVGKLSEMSLMTSSETKEREKEIDQFLNREKREHNKEKLQYNLFTL